MIENGDRVSGGAVDLPTRAYSYWATSCLAVVYMFNFMDRQMVSILAEPIKRDLELSDTELGLLSGFVFALFYSALAIPIARLADRTHRVGIVAVSCGIWSLFTLCCGLATSFFTLALSRIGVAAGEAGGVPPSYSIIADYFRPSERATGMAIFSLGVPLGTTLGALAGAWIAASFGWRAAFVTAGIAGLIVAPLLPLAVKEPPRGRHDLSASTADDGQSGRSLLQVVRLFMSSPVLVLTGLGAGLGSFTGYAMLMWLPTFLIRNAGMSLYEIAFWYSLTSGLCLAIGTWLSGALTDRLGRSDPAFYGLVPAAAALLTAPFLLLTLNAQSWPVALAFLAPTLIFGIVYLSPAVAVVQNNLPADCRATGSAILLLWFNLVGLGAGPFCVGMISDTVAPVHGERSLVVALQWLAPMFFLTALCQFAASRAMRRTLIVTRQAMPSEKRI